MEQQPSGSSRNSNDDPLAQLEQDSDFKNAYGEFDKDASEKEHPLLASYDQPEGAVLHIQTESKDGMPKELTFVRTRYEKESPSLGWSLRQSIPGSDDFVETPVHLTGLHTLPVSHDGPRKGLDVIYSFTEDKVFKSGSELEKDDQYADWPAVDDLDSDTLNAKLAAKAVIRLEDGSLAWRTSRSLGPAYGSGAVTGASVELSEGVKPIEAEPPQEVSLEDPEEQAERARITPEVEEILSNYQFLKSDIRKGAVDVQNVFTKAWAAARNAASTPGKLRRDMAKDWADIRHDRASNKTDIARQKYEEAAALQDQSNSRIVNMYRERKAARQYTKYMERVKKQANRKAILDGKTAAYDGHVAMMEGRKTGVIETAAERRQSIDQHRNVLMEQRIAAESRKLERQKRRTQRLELLKNRSDLSHAEREALANRLSPEARKEIREKAIATIKAKNIRTRTMINY